MVNTNRNSQIPTKSPPSQAPVIENDKNISDAADAANAVYIEQLQYLYLQDPNLVDSEWRNFFESLEDKAINQEAFSSSVNLFNKLSKAKVIGAQQPTEVNGANNKEPKLSEIKNNNNSSHLIELQYLSLKSYISLVRKEGHKYASLSPLNENNANELHNKHSEMLKKLMSQTLPASILSNPQQPFEPSLLEKLKAKNDSDFLDLGSFSNLNQLNEILTKQYAGSIGVEFAYIDDDIEKKWLYSNFEQEQSTETSKNNKLKIWQFLTKVKSFEHYIHVKFPGAKRFSVEGAESSILALEHLVNISKQFSVSNIVVGMAHRGRLSALANVFGKQISTIFSEFKGKVISKADSVRVKYSGDVKYHMGFKNIRSYDPELHDLSGSNASGLQETDSTEKVTLELAYNPSHLEAVNPVVAGICRAMQDEALKKMSAADEHDSKKARAKILPVLIHGDAAFAGQGVVGESLLLSTLSAYENGGTIHIIINNQVGFTANPADGRPGKYCTEIAKQISAPIIHVNGNDPEAVLRGVNTAMAYRNKFGKDFIIDIICYRKYGHNEGDEPRFTQSQMYKIIDSLTDISVAYQEKLIKDGIINKQISSDFLKITREKLDASLDQANHIVENAKSQISKINKSETPSEQNVVTGVDLTKIRNIADKLFNVPESVPALSKVRKLLATRAQMVKDGTKIDWATAEALAFATLLTEQVPIRLSGQDCGRGTFSHRHAVVHNSNEVGNNFVPLNHVSQNQEKFESYDSVLSEYAVLGFEYGYSLFASKALVLWEAQFGDFANGAQIIIDQFIAAAEAKWAQCSSLVLLLPHGYEGQGPEHSSARLERFLQLAADNNMCIINPTTPASIFHALRRAKHQAEQKPLVIMTPKSLLRLKDATSDLSEIAKGTSFSPILVNDGSVKLTKKIKNVIFCSGKVYYDLQQYKIDQKLDNAVLIRTEQLFPFPEHEISKQLKLMSPNLSDTTKYIWCQEEPQNMGAWSYIKDEITSQIKKHNSKAKLQYAGRVAAASPAVGTAAEHAEEQKQLVKQALD